MIINLFLCFHYFLVFYIKKEDSFSIFFKAKTNPKFLYSIIHNPHGELSNAKSLSPFRLKLTVDFRIFVALANQRFALESKPLLSRVGLI